MGDGRIWYEDNKSSAWRKFWWDESKAEVHKGVAALVRNLRDNQKYHHKRNAQVASMYDNIDYPGLDADEYAQIGTEDRISYNVIESAIDTIHADIVAARPKPMFLTQGGNAKSRKEAEGLNKFAGGQFHHARINQEVAPEAAMHALVFGTSAIKVGRDEAKMKPRADLTFIDELVVDDNEAAAGKPLQMFQRSLVSRKLLQALYPSKKEKIKQTPLVEVRGTRHTLADHVALIEAWHPPTSPSIDDGRRVLVLENCTLRDEKWDRGYPFAFLRYKKRIRGFFGKGVAEILDGAQLAINELLWKIHMSLKLAGPKVFVEPGSQLNTALLDNEIWGIIETAAKPFMAVFESVPPDLFRQLMTEIEQAFALVGVNMMAARSEMPRGMEGASGKALRIYSDTKSKRFVRFAQAYEQMHLDLAEQMIEETRRIEKEGEPAELSFLAPADDGTAELVDWEKVNLDRDKYLMQSFPTSFFSGTPASKLQDMYDFLKLFPEARDLVKTSFDFPDTKWIMQLSSGPIEAARMMLESIVEDGKYISPEPEMDLEKSIQLALLYMAKAHVDGEPEATIELLRKWVGTAKSMLQPPPEAPPPVPGPPGPPGPMGPEPAAGPMALPPPTGMLPTQ